MQIRQGDAEITDKQAAGRLELIGAWQGAGRGRVSRVVSRDTTGPEKGPIEQQLEFQRRILTLESELRGAKLQNAIASAMATLLFLTYAIAIIGIPAIGIATYATYGRVDLGMFNRIGIPVTVVCVIASFVLKESLVEFSDFARVDVAERRLELSLAKERRRLYAASIELDIVTQRHIYKETIPSTVEDFRRGSAQYRRIHNGFQSVIILGSFAMTALSAMANDWASVGVSFSVGVASGFAGYFKFKERGFYLQQSADAIEQEVDAASLNIGPYKGKSKDEALGLFTERVEALKVEQRKREQQLDQPSDRSEGGGV
ncbi:SLATT domain-containing protein [Streptomyces sp. NPDC057136]|uniref:SLATT domain-containing protein n=1 Tax=Streptomyces sp. NPDC057136 TaxID=3346029 RepID=UPI0036384BDB